MRISVAGTNRSRAASRQSALLAIGLLASTSSMAASAQSAQSDAQPTAPDQAAASVGDIIVTAQRRSERLQDVPAAVSAFDGRMLESSGIQGSKQLSQVTPGLNFTQSVFSPQPTIRGIGTRGVGAGDESLVPIYIDGVYQAFLAGADLQFNNVERIEVLKGPQSILYGRNATGGAINIVTRTPDKGATGAVSLSYGNFNQLVVKGYAGLGGEKLAGDLAFISNRDDGYIRDLGRRDTIGSRQDFSIRGKLVYGKGDPVELRLSASYTDNKDSTGQAYRAYRDNTIGRRTPGNLFGSEAYTAYLSLRPRNDVIQKTVSGTAIFRLEGATITSLTGFQDSRLHIDVDSDASVANISSGTYLQTSKNIYHETYVTTEGDGPFSAIGGFVYYHDTSAFPHYNNFANGVSSLYVSASFGDDSYAGYLQGTYKITPELSLTAGGRYTKETRTVSTNVGTNPATTTHFDRSATFNKFTPSATLQYQPSRALNIYARYGQAFKSGLFNSTATTSAALAPVRPETVTQYELGFKADPAPWLRVNMSGYYTDYKMLQSSARDPVTLSAFLQNAGGAEIYGGEAEMILRPVDRLNIRMGAALLHGKYRNFPNSQVTIPATTIDPPVASTCVAGTGTPIGGNRTAICDVTGNSIIRTPFVTFNVGGDYSIPVGDGEIDLSGNVYYSGHSYWDTLNRLREPSKLLVNGEIAWKVGTSGVRVAVWGDNLLDEKYSLTMVSSGSADSQVLAQPRTYGIRISFDY